MKYKRQLMGGMLALTIVVSGSTVFAADINATSSTKLHQFKSQIKMKATESDGKIDTKDVNGNDIETNDDATTTPGIGYTKIHQVKNKTQGATNIKPITTKKAKTTKVHKTKEVKTASSTKSM